ncbi:fungal-specific transcription factor domain-containing protein [Apodospora peruviana]|uniref:Fungal-specific transcription factor domain-containing protein n=1 Tax=Apodospora peruviana TaxID=516989 RepID=A0AAE0HVX1_9PEZI|nr:fungal-specific transcription factor domain-containing protein [Apodospora peruviana]
MPGASVAVMPSSAASTPASRKTSLVPPERKYKCQFCNRAFSRSEHRSRHERSRMYPSCLPLSPPNPSRCRSGPSLHRSLAMHLHFECAAYSRALRITLCDTDTKERPFKCQKCRSTFVRRDLLLRHDRTVHAKDGGVPLHSDGKRRGGPKTARASAPSKAELAIDTSAALEQLGEGFDMDAQTAAMLLTDAQHKAHAAAQVSGHYDASPDMSITQNDSTMMESSATYSNSAIGLSQWDSFLSSEAKPHSIGSSGGGSFEAQNPDHLPSIGGHNFNGLAPALQSMINSLPPSATGTPTPQSPYVTHRSASHDDSAHSSTGFKAPQVKSDDERNTILDNIRGSAGEAIPDGFRLPSLPNLNRYLSTYFTWFHHHLPFLHPASFEPTQVAPPLLLAVLSIGALYAFNQEQAYMMHIGAKVMINQFLQNKENFSSRKCPLWTMQSSLLNMVFASWSGDPKGLEWACSIKSLLANMVAGNHYELRLRQEAREGRSPTRAEWVEDEGCRRTYYAVYIFFGLLTLTYNHTPAISFNEFEDLQLPSTEALWNVRISNEAAWQDLLKDSPSVTFMEAHDNLFQGETLKYSAFATRVMINALFLEVWYHKRSPEALQDVVTEYKLRLALETWEKSLDLCEPENADVQLSAPHEGHPLIFNAKAMFRNARARLEVDLKTVQEALRYHDSYEVAAAMSNARDRVKRSSEMIKVIQECYNCIETAVNQGIRWVARTSPTNWSVEHPLCGMDLMIILSLWLYRLEHDEEPATEEELVMYNKVRQLFAKDLDEPYVAQLSSVVARLWGTLLDEVVVWGITRLMGESFRLHSQALVGYVDDVAASSNVSTPSMTSQGADEDSVY